MKVVTADEMRRIESRSMISGVSKPMLMERAGLKVAQRIRYHLDPINGVPVLVLIGPGNNGGDGLVVSRHLTNWGAKVAVCLCSKRLETEAELGLLLGSAIVPFNLWDDNGLATFLETLSSSHMVVDAVFGTGRLRPIDGLLAKIFSLIDTEISSRGYLKLLAVDLPSGMDADTGVVDPATPSADITVSLGYPKRGHFCGSGVDRTGLLEVVDIGIPSGFDEDVSLRLMTKSAAQGFLPKRPLRSHKGSFGKVMVVGGSKNYVGAVSLAGLAAARVGAGLVTLAVPQSIQCMVAPNTIEPTYIPLPESLSGTVMPLESAELILGNLLGYSALLVGCGLGASEETKSMITKLLFSDDLMLPVIVDADGLNTLSALPEWWKCFSNPAILTPHLGEMARLTGQSINYVENNRIPLSIEVAVNWNKVIVLKGAHTLVATPEGTAILSPFANPALASAGTGDVLSGVIAGLLSQGLSLETAAALGVYIHAAAASRLNHSVGSAGMLASDLLPVFPATIQNLKDSG